MEETFAMNFNFFSWLRTGVRQSVLLGVSDAVQEIGVPPNSEEVSQGLIEVFRGGETRQVSHDSPKRSPRRKLGRSLKQIQAESSKAE
jgi:hypothetical protein